MPTNYPTDFPMATAAEVVAIIKSGEAIAKKAELAKDLWIIQGYAQAQLLGDPATGSTSSSVTTVSGHLSAEAAPDFDGLATLERLSAESISAESVIDWKSLVIWALEEGIKLWLQHKAAPPATPST